MDNDAGVTVTMEWQDLVSCIARWWMVMQEYNMELEYRLGEKCVMYKH